MNGAQAPFIKLFICLHAIDFRDRNSMTRLVIEIDHVYRYRIRRRRVDCENSQKEKVEPS